MLKLIFFNLYPSLCIANETKTMIQKEEELLRKGEVEKEKEIDIYDSKEKENGGKRAGARKRTM